MTKPLTDEERADLRVWAADGSRKVCLPGVTLAALLDECDALAGEVERLRERLQEQDETIDALKADLDKAHEESAAHEAEAEKYLSQAEEVLDRVKHRAKGGNDA